MAKVVGMIGSASGKIGNVVYSVSNGIQTAKVYQPVVANPKSRAQMLQRAKANLAGRLSAVTPRDAIVGLGDNNRQRRAAYLKNILLNATSTLSDGKYVAKLVPQNLVFSVGSTVPVIIASGATISSQGLLTISYTRAGYALLDVWNPAGGMWVVVAVDDITGNYDFVTTTLWEKPSFPESSTVLTQTIPVENIDAHDVFVYFVPFSLESQSASTVSGGLGVDATEYVAMVGLTSAASKLAFGHSKCVGLAVASA